jgi:phosphohistidine swiveling domain-containing protein
MLDSAGDVYFLDSGELRRAITDRAAGVPQRDLAALARERRELREARKRLHPPAAVLPESGMRVGKIDLSERETQRRNAAGATTLRGFAVSSGQVTAPASVILSPEGFDQMEPGTILVCPTTTPAWTPLFAQARGLVTDIGGILAHGSIVAREFGIPAVMGTGNATQRIANGQQITVDGSAGTVELELDRTGTVGPLPASTAPRLYQSQHPPLAYLLALPVWHVLHTAHPLEAIAALRALNLLVVAAALVLFAAALERLVPPFGLRVAVLALVCLHPLFFQNVARVANDGLAVATGIAGISLLVLADGRTFFSRSVLAAACLAASVWSKQTSLTVIPALALLPLIGWAHQVPRVRLWRATMASAVAFVVLTAPLWIWNYQRYGVILTTQDSVELAARGSTSAALTGSFAQVPWASVVETFIVPGRPWVGGWSYLAMPPSLSTLHGWYWGAVLAAAVAGALMAMGRRSEQLDRMAIGTLGVCATVVLFTTLGMSYHIVLSQAVYGRVMTNPWYFMTVLPFFFVLLVRGLDAIDHRLAIGAAAGLAALYVGIDQYGTWIQMPAAYANVPKAALQWARLGTMHPAILSGTLRWWFLGLQVAALACVAAALVHARRMASHSGHA